MTLDTLTRAQAEVSHVRLKNSLVQTSQTFREHFRAEKEIFRTIAGPDAAAVGTTRPRTPNKTSPKPLTALTVPPGYEEDIVRLERLNQCCKRVRIWRRQVTNPLLQYRQQQHVSGKGGPGGVSSNMSTSKKPDRRMHATLLMALIVDLYEQRIFSEVDGAIAVDTLIDGATTTSSGTDFQESFPEFVVRFLSQRASNRRLAVDQLHSTVSTVLHSASNHARVRVFGSLCGIDDKFNPPEKVKVFLHILETLYRSKVAASIGASGANTARIEEIATSIPLADVVFHNVGIAQNVAQQVIGDLFRDNFYWNFRFWLTPCTELRVDSSWPVGVCEELQERALTLATASRNTLLNAHRKIDGDDFLELLIHAWTTRANQLHAQLESAGNDLLRSRQVMQEVRMQHRPTTDEERQFFDQLIDEYWDAPVSRTSTKVQARIAALVPRRPLTHLQQLYAVFLAELPPSRRSWEWRNWRWETEWEWGALVLTSETRK
ncbi:hypothetical protein PF005_g4085 [Phytophthora fragariae]|uniref:Uncharacterized protein n=1 Tax=Phytophthora fragariae TaxID=53985 RepID=A0A6A3T920_9STRA|nr:hypothetical protein PF003_g20787 [Phytophthora fragariae]KAE8945763.1 hypothetical protein PF009_g4588 [Phytophthora fragariae]KAE9005158.1 hypothetical protein PF011_g12159 [Phytophthora fragariae]KAE9105595.1 hypothetical protein PF010_g12962 [Phytophthora fragariae]KAE9131534.1 hypothetical protein PF007_g4073 [Phytophthora fragariae]